MNMLAAGCGLATTPALGAIVIAGLGTAVGSGSLPLSHEPQPLQRRRPTQANVVRKVEDIVE